MVYTYEQRTKIVEWYIETKSYVKTQRRFAAHFETRAKPGRRIIQYQVEKFREHGTAHNLRSGDVSLAIFVTSVSGSKSPASFTNRLFHLSRPPGFRRAFDAAESNGRFSRIQCQRGKESSCRGKRKRRVFLCRRTVRVKVGGKAIPASFLKIEGRGTLVGAKHRRERDGKKNW